MTSDEAKPATGEPVIVVGVDGSYQSEVALSWAAVQRGDGPRGDVPRGDMSVGPPPN